MKQKHLFLAGLAGTLVLATQTIAAQTWQTVDDFQYTAGYAAVNQGLVVAPSGIVYACGWAADGTTRRGLVMASTDGGSTWSAPIDDVVYAGYATMDDGGIVADSGGNLYVAGRNYVNHQFVRRSTDGGITWQTVDDAALGTPSSTLLGAGGIAADGNGNVYVVGRALNTWSIREGIVGTSFFTADTFQPGASQACAVFAHPVAGVFAVGQGTITITGKRGSSTSTGWFVRRSLDGGVTWATVDSYQASSGYQAAARGIGADARGNIYVVGYASVPNKSSSVSHWQVRKSADNGATWTTVDDYAPTGGGQAIGFAADANGNLFVAGDTAGWTVRESAGGIGAWTTVDNVTNLGVHAIAADHIGNVFVGGTGNLTGSSAVQWVVRKN